MLHSPKHYNFLECFIAVRGHKGVDMSSDWPISRRDFLNGAALSIATGAALRPPSVVAGNHRLHSDYYPPALTGMRGSHDGSFETMHSLAWGGEAFSHPATQTGPIYDLVIVGAGISGLAAAKFFRDRSAGGKKILLLDNHDDFGGHAKRNEFTVNGEKLITWGGSQTLESPSLYSDVAKKLLRDVGIKVDRFYDYFDQEFYGRRKLGIGTYFDKKTFGRSALTKNPFWPLRNETFSDDELSATLADMPISEATRNAFFDLYTKPKDYFASMSKASRIERAYQLSYHDFLKEYAGATDELLAVIRDSFQPLVSVGWDAASVYAAAEYGMPGTWLLKLHDTTDDEEGDPYIHHFPDGNASLARALVRDLIPDSLAGDGMESLVRGKLNYDALDRPENDIQIRLNSTAVHVTHAGDGGKFVDASYVTSGKLYRARARHVVMACYNGVIPYICPDVPAEQADALAHCVKSPFVIGNIALKNWRAFDAAGIRSVYTPGAHFFKYMALDFPVSIGDYKFAKSPDDPIVLNSWHAPTQPGLPMKDQLRAGRYKLLATSFADFENDIIAQLNGMLSKYGFDAKRDIAGITTNRWSHGYAWEYGIAAGEDPSFNVDNGPHIAGRAQIGRISIANSDSHAYAYVNGAIDAADRAINEQLA